MKLDTNMRTVDRAPRRLLQVLFLGLGLSLSGVAATACGPQAPAVVKADLKPGPMPADGSWRGVYYDQTYGFLHILATGENVTGKWRTSAGDKWGELHGKADGDVLRFQWKEHKIGMFGPNATTEGQGFFRYVDPGNGQDHELHGEWGLGDDEGGNPWNCVKQRNVDPDFNAVMPDETQTSVKGGDWDSGPSDAAAGAKPSSGEAADENAAGDGDGAQSSDE